MIAFIDDHRDAYGVEPLCRVLRIAPSTYHDHAARRADSGKLAARTQQDMALKPEIARVFAEPFEIYGARKVWQQMLREGFTVARCTVERLMRDKGLQGAVRGKPVRTTISDKAGPCPLDHVNRVFAAPAPNMLWLSDFTYVSTRVARTGSGERRHFRAYDGDGRPKGAIISHRRTVLDALNALPIFGIKRSERFFCYMLQPSSRANICNCPQ